MRQGKVLSVVFGVFAALVLAAGSVSATIIRVPADYPRVQLGINAAGSGDTVLVAAGRYAPSTNGEVFYIRMKNGVRLFGAGADACTLDAEGTDVVIYCYGLSDTATRIEGFTITNGSYSYGGGIYCYRSSPIIGNNVITGNYARSYGGGICCRYYSDATITSNVITGNSSPYSGGIECYRSSPIITNNTITGNSASNYGGGIRCYYCSPPITNNVISGNSGRYGGGMYCYYSDAPITNNVISENSASYYGGGMYCYYSNATITNNVISGNSNPYYGGGMYCYRSSPPIINNVISGNSAYYYGGGMYCYYSDPTITNNTITGNSNPYYGGGIYCSRSSPPITNNVITGNSARYRGGGIYCSASSPAITYDDVWGNPGGDYYGCSAGTGCISADPLFVDPTGDDYHLRWGSPCIDAGDNNAPALPGLDFDGNPRIHDGDLDGIAIVDMGPFEFIPPPGLYIIEEELSADYAPPDPWVQQEFAELEFRVIAVGTSLSHIRFFSDPLEHEELPKKIPDDLVEFIPEEIGSLEEGDIAQVIVKVEIPIGQHEGDYMGYFRAVCCEGYSDSVAVTVTVEPSADIDFDREEVALRAPPGGSDSDLCVVVNPNSWENNPDRVDGPGNVDLGSISYQFTDLTGAGGTIPSSEVSVSGNQSSLGSGASDEVTLTVNVPSDQLAGEYRGKAYVRGTPVPTGEPIGTRKADPPVVDSLVLEVTVLPQMVLDIAESSVSAGVTPPDPWPEPLSGEFSFRLVNLGNDTLENIEFASTDLELADHAPLYGRTVEFHPPRIPSMPPDTFLMVTATVPVPIGTYTGLYVGTFLATAAAMEGAADELEVNLTVDRLADLDIHDYAGNLSANTMRLIGPSEAIVAGIFNEVSPNMWDNNYDPFDGPGNVDLSDIDYVATDLVCQQGHTIPSGQVTVPALGALGSGEAHQHIISVDLTDIHPNEKDYSGYVFARVAGDSEDVFTLVVNVDASGQLSGNGFRGEPLREGNLLEWKFGFDQQGFNLYRSEPGAASFVRLNSSLVNGTSYIDGDVLAGSAYQYKLGLLFAEGREILLGPLSVTASKGTGYTLFQNAPNPMREETEIRYAVACRAKVSLRIYDVAGRVMKTLVDEEQTRGYYQVSWKPEDVANGVYFYRLEAGDFSSTKRLVVLR